MSRRLGRRLAALTAVAALGLGACGWPVDKHARRLPASRVPPGLRDNPSR